jgi:hypothetical protein
VIDLVAMWRDYAHHNKQRALAQRATGDVFGARLSTARADVRAQAAELVAKCATPTAAAMEMPGGQQHCGSQTCR